MNSIALPTIKEEPEIASESSRRAKKKRLTAVFDFQTFKLDSKMMDREERERMRKRSNEFLSAMAVQEYSDTTKDFMISLIVVPGGIIKKSSTLRFPCINGRREIIIKKRKKKANNDGSYVTFIKLSSGDWKPKKPIKMNKTGYSFVAFWKNCNDNPKLIGTFYHCHGSSVYQPTFDEREQEIRQFKDASFKIKNKVRSINISSKLKSLESSCSVISESGERSSISTVSSSSSSSSSSAISPISTSSPTAFTSKIKVRKEAMV